MVFSLISHGLNLTCDFWVPFCPNVVPARRSSRRFCPVGTLVLFAVVAILRWGIYPIRTVIQFSICPSIGRQREGPKINPLCKIVWTVSITAKRAGTQHIKSAGDDLSLYLWWNYVPALLFRNLQCLLFPLRWQTQQQERRSRNLCRRLPCVSFQIFSCGSPKRAYRLYHIEHLFVKRF